MSGVGIPQQLTDYLEQEAKILGQRRDELMKNGFSREEAMAIILASIPNARDEVVFRPPRFEP